MSLKCIIVDDEEMSRLVVKNFVDKTDYLKLSHEVSNGEEAFNLLTKHENPDVDIIFLDIQMPGMSGIELMKKLGGAYQIIFITSEVKYAVEAFEGSVTDFLVKPFEYDRFLQATEKAKINIEKQRILAESFNEIFVKSDSRLVCLQMNDILFVEALADYIIFNTGHEKFIVHHTMKGIERKLPGSVFTRIHRSFIVNIQKINYIEDMHVHIGPKPIPIGASFKDRLFNKLNLL